MSLVDIFFEFQAVYLVLPSFHRFLTWIERDLMGDPRPIHWILFFAFPAAQSHAHGGFSFYRVFPCFFCLSFTEFFYLVWSGRYLGSLRLTCFITQAPPGLEIVTRFDRVDLLNSVKQTIKSTRPCKTGPLLGYGQQQVNWRKWQIVTWTWNLYLCLDRQVS